MHACVSEMGGKNGWKIEILHTCRPEVNCIRQQINIPRSEWYSYAASELTAFTSWRNAVLTLLYGCIKHTTTVWFRSCLTILHSHPCTLAPTMFITFISSILSLIHLIFPVCAFVRFAMVLYCIFVIGRWSTNPLKTGIWLDGAMTYRKHGRSGSVQVPRSQPSFRHSALLKLGLLGATRTFAEVYCYFLVRGNCSGYRYVGIFVSLFEYFSCQPSGLLKALSLWQSKLLGRKLAWLRHCLIG